MSSVCFNHTLKISKSSVITIFRILETTHTPTMLEILGNYTPFQLLVTTLLSSRTKDSTTIPLVKKMFEKYLSPKDYLKLTLSEIEGLIYGIGFYKTKALQIQKTSQILLEKYNGIVPNTLEDLTSLPGVGRKTANCVLAYVFHQPAIAVDVHVQRIANRLGWINTKIPEQTELELQKIVPKEEWINVNRLLVGHGQSICLPINPQCGKCSVRGYCQYGLRES